MIARGLYEGGGHATVVVDDPYGPARLVDLDSGEVHGLYPDGPAFLIGSGFATRNPVGGTARFDAAGARLAGESVSRRRLRQLEVRFRSGDAVLSGTLTLPPARGRHAAVAFVHGSGPTERAYLPELHALLVHNGVAVLAYDKRGIGQSGGSYPGESPTASANDVLARDAAAAARFLRSQPEIDRARVGLAGHSQAGWIMPLAGSREPAIRFLVVFSGPAVTADENDLYQDLRARASSRRNCRTLRSTRRFWPRAGWHRSDSVDPEAPHPCALGVRRPRPPCPAAPVRAASRADRAGTGPRLHHHGLPESEPRAGRDHYRPDVGDASFRHIRAGPVRPGRGLAASPRPRTLTARRRRR
jgi:dienelactone hydrolase